MIKGTGILTLDDEQYTMSVGTTMKINIEAKHRMTNDTNYDVEFIEVQIGEYLGEDDIVRLNDDYGRLN